MNTLVLLASEMRGEQVAVISGERAQRFIEEQRPEVGKRIRIALLDRWCAYGNVMLIEKSKVEIAVLEKIEPLPRMALTLFVAVPRPQTVKKVISLAAQAGVQRLYFVKSYHTVPSYLQSHSLLEEGIVNECIKGMEQVWDCYRPKISVVERMGEFFDTTLPALMKECAPTHLFLGEPRGQHTREAITLLQSVKVKHVVLGIGPEKGWSESELDGFQSLGFIPAHLDHRAYRVETALAFFIGQFKIFAALNDHRVR